MKKHVFTTTFPLLVCIVAIQSCKDDAPELFCESVEWTYESNSLKGPDNWANLCADFSSCNGAMQSPINIAGAEDDFTLIPIADDYVLTTTHIRNEGHTIKFYVDAGSTISVDGKTYKLQQFHTHTASEHTIEGVSYAMEIHFVHKDDISGNLAMIAVFVKEGAINLFLEPFISNLPVIDNDEYNDPNYTYNVIDCLPPDKDYFTYIGSNTTPPCAEIVTWFVMEHPIEASSEQIAAFRNLEHNNNRPLQPLGGRSIKHYFN